MISNRISSASTEAARKSLAWSPYQNVHVQNKWSSITIWQQVREIPWQTLHALVRTLCSQRSYKWRHGLAYQAQWRPLLGKSKWQSPEALHWWANYLTNYLKDSLTTLASSKRAWDNKAVWGVVARQLGECRFGLSQVSRLCRKGCAVTLTSREATVVVNIHEKMSGLWKKGVSGGQLRDRVRRKNGTIYRMINRRAPKKVGANEFEFQNTYKSQGGIHQMSYTFKESKLLCLLAAMELFIINAQGVHLRVVIWPRNM